MVVPSLDEPVGERWRSVQADVTNQRRFRIAAPLSSTPVPIYEWVLQRAEAFERWSQVDFVLMDEQLEGQRPPFRYVHPTDDASYEGFANRRFLTPLRGATGLTVPILKPDLETLDSFEPTIDLLILALGVDGNYAGVMPGTRRHESWHVAHLTPAFRTVHTSADSSSYAGAQFREFGMSLGPKQLREAGSVIVCISGSRKRQLAEQLLTLDHFDNDFPLSIIYDDDIAPKVEIFLTSDVGLSI